MDPVSAPRQPLVRFALASLLLAIAPMPARAITNSHVEEFDNATYKDVANTTADWNTAAGKLQLFQFQPTLLGTYDTPGDAYGVAVSGSVAYVAALNSGLMIFNISNPASPILLGTYDTPSLAWDVEVSGMRAYVADQSSGLQIIDVSNPASPILLGTYNTPGSACDVELAKSATYGTVAYVADYLSGFEVINVSNPASPTLLGSYDTPGSAWNLEVSGTLLYVADGTSGLEVFNVGNPASPTLVGSYNTPGDARGVAVSAAVVYVADWLSGLQILNVSNPASPTLLGSYDTPGGANDVEVSGAMAYVSDGPTLQILNASNPASPSLASSFLLTPGSTFDVEVSGTTAYVADGSAGLQSVSIADQVPPALIGSSPTPAGGAIDVEVSGTLAYVADGASGLQIFDVGNPASPTLLGSYDTPGSAQGVAISGTVAYVADDASGLVVLNVSNPASPTFLSSYDTPGTAYDVKVSGEVAFVADGWGGLQILNVSNPASPTLLSSYNTSGPALEVEVSGTVAYVAAFTGGLKILNVSNLASPTLLGSYVLGGGVTINAVAVSGKFAYLAQTGGASDGLKILDVGNPASPTPIGYYDTHYFPAYGVAGSGAGADRAGGWSGGVHVVSVSNPASPSLIGYFYSAPARDVEISGTAAYVASLNGGLLIGEVAQNRFDLTRNVGRSVAVDATADAISRARVRSTQVNGVGWELSADGGANWQAAAPGGDWVALTAGSDLRWRATLSAFLPYLTYPPAASRVELDWLYTFPVVESVADVGNDQGRQVRLAWTRSNSDFVGASPQVTEYAVYRRIDAGLASPAATRRATGALEIEAAFAEGWDFVTTVPAEAEDAYSVVVPTLADSTIADGQHWSAFRVRARTATPGVYYESYPDSGYSEDNLAPNAPSALVVSYQGGSGNHLDWADPVDADFRYFKIYRSADPGFIPGPANLLHSTTATEWTDASFSGGTAYYKLTAVDFSGNESGAASTNITVGVGDALAPLRFALHAASLNPFAQSTTFRYDVPSSGGAVKLGVYDVGGRLVRSLVDGVQAPGTKTVAWDGRDGVGRVLPAGVYLVRMQAGEFAGMRKLVLSR